MGTETLPRPDWGYWTNLARVSIRDAVLLSRDTDPQECAQWFPVDRPGRNEWPDDEERLQIRTIKLRLTWAESAALSRTFGDYPVSGGGMVLNLATKQTTLTEFRTWGESLPQPLTFPDEFPESDPSASASQRWPWGDHETELLRVLGRAQREWWSTWEPGIKPPNSKDVAAWIAAQTVKGKPVSPTVAKAIAQILRADGLPNRTA